MKTLKTLALITGSLIATAAVAGSDDHDTLQMTLVNNTNTTLTFTGAKNQNPGNIFAISKTSVGPHESAVVTGKITQDTDLAANLHFQDAAGNDNILLVIDPRNMHAMQPLFNMHNDRLHSILKSQKHGDGSVARGLLITESAVEIEAV